MQERILVWMTSPACAELLDYILTEQGFHVVTAADGQTALYSARHSQPDLVLLDIMMPKMDGYQFLRQFRQERQTPVIIITAREEETDAVLGLDLGADDYVNKPFRMRELLARIRAVLRRAEGPGERPEVFRVGEIELDQANSVAKVKDEERLADPDRVRSAGVFLRSPGQVFTRNRLVERLATAALPVWTAR